MISNLFPHLYRPNKQKCSCQTETSWKKKCCQRLFKIPSSQEKKIAKNSSKYRKKKKKIVIFSKTFWRNAMTLSSKLSNKVGKIYLMKIQTFWEKKKSFLMCRCRVLPISNFCQTLKTAKHPNPILSPPGRKKNHENVPHVFCAENHWNCACVEIRKSREAFVVR